MLFGFWKRGAGSSNTSEAGGSPDVPRSQVEDQRFDLHNRADLTQFLTSLIRREEERSRLQHACPDLTAYIPELAERYVDVVLREGTDDIDDQKFGRILRAFIEEGLEVFKGLEMKSGNVNPINAVPVLVNSWAGIIANEIANYR